MRFWSTGIAIALTLSFARAARAQMGADRSVSVTPGIGGGYTVAPSYAEQSPGGDWNAEAFASLAFSRVPVELRPTVFSYGRGTGAHVVQLDCPAMSCPNVYANGSGRERATGGSLDLVVRYKNGPFVPYLFGGPNVAYITRQVIPIGSTVHGAGLGYDLGAGGRIAVGRLTLFGEAKFFAAAGPSAPLLGVRGTTRSVYMVPLTVGVAF